MTVLHLSLLFASSRCKIHTAYSSITGSSQDSFAKPYRFKLQSFISILLRRGSRFFTQARTMMLICFVFLFCLNGTTTNVSASSFFFFSAANRRVCLESPVRVTGPSLSSRFTDVVMFGFKTRRRAHPCCLCLVMEEIEQQ
ncbi:hypothetical protein Rs2_41247 [Raphanus sativus]|nr:hypothetical protein Rs2_41247 [Raphanus sativus]